MGGMRIAFHMTRYGISLGILEDGNLGQCPLVLQRLSVASWGWSSEPCPTDAWDGPGSLPTKFPTN